MKTLIDIKREIIKLLEENNCFVTTRYCVGADEDIIQIIRNGGREVIDLN